MFLRPAQPVPDYGLASCELRRPTTGLNRHQEPRKSIVAAFTNRMPMTAKETRTLIAFIVALAAVSGGATDHSFTLCPSDGNVCHEVDTSRGVALSGYLERRRKQEEGHLFLETVANAELIVLVNFINTVPYLGTVFPHY